MKRSRQFSAVHFRWLVASTTAAAAIGGLATSCGNTDLGCADYATCSGGSAGTSTEGGNGTAGTDGQGGKAAGGTPATGGTEASAGTLSGGSSSGAAGETAAAGAAGTGNVPCDATKSPFEEACLVSDDFAIF